MICYVQFLNTQLEQLHVNSYTNSYKTLALTIFLAHSEIPKFSTTKYGMLIIIGIIYIRVLFLSTNGELHLNS